MRAALAVALVLALGACDVNPFDADQVPQVTVTVAAEPVFSWTPAGAQLVRVYRGDRALDTFGPDLLWELQAEDGRNGISGPVAYGTAPPGTDAPRTAAELVVGETYTVWVRRYDEAGGGDGFTNTRNTYVGSATFTR